MDTIPRIWKYIAKEKIANSIRYQMDLDELLDLKELGYTRPHDALCLAFDYGRAKGHRAAKAEMRTKA